MENKALLFSSKKGGRDFAQMGIDLGIGAIFVLAIGLTVTESIIADLTTPADNVTPALLTGTAATVAAFVGLVIIAAFIFGVAKLFKLI